MLKIQQRSPLENSLKGIHQDVRKYRLALMESWVGVHEENTRLIPLTKGRFAKVDEADYEWLMQWNWCLHKKYAARRQNRKWVFMHHAIAGSSGTLDVDHKNRNEMDNRRANLRFGTRCQNIANTGLSKRNTTGFKGVNFHKATQRFTASIRVNGKQHHIGMFDDAKTAAIAYNRWAVKAHGEFACPNVITSQSPV